MRRCYASRSRKIKTDKRDARALCDACELPGQGNRRLRSLLVECAWGILRRAHPETEALRDWALRIAVRIAQRRGKRIAAVALARKLAGILFATTRDNTTFAGNSNQQAESVAA